MGEVVISSLQWSVHISQSLRSADMTSKKILEDLSGGKTESSIWNFRKAQTRAWRKEAI